MLVRHLVHVVTDVLPVLERSREMREVIKEAELVGSDVRPCLAKSRDRARLEAEENLDEGGKIAVLAAFLRHGQWFSGCIQKIAKIPKRQHTYVGDSNKFLNDPDALVKVLCADNLGRDPLADGIEARDEIWYA